MGDLHNNPHGWLLLCLNQMTKLARSWCVRVRACGCVCTCNHMRPFFSFVFLYLTKNIVSAACFLTNVNNLHLLTVPLAVVPFFVQKLRAACLYSLILFYAYLFLFVTFWMNHCSYRSLNDTRRHYSLLHPIPIGLSPPIASLN